METASSLLVVSLLAVQVLLQLPAVSAGYAPRQVCHTEYETVTSYEEQCSTSYEQECSTEQEQQCSTSYEQQCSTTYEQQCSTTYEQKCSTSYEDQCTSSIKNECSTTYEEVCSTDYQQKCSTTYEEQCSTSYEQQCSTIYEQECSTSGYGSHKSCHQVPKKSCKQVPKQSCHKVPRERCHQEPSQNCHQVPKEICRQVPMQNCQKVPRESCQKVPKQTCQQVPKENCHQVPKQTCHQVPKTHCKDVPRQSCTSTPVHKKVAKEVCSPKTHGAKVFSQSHSRYKREASLSTDFSPQVNFQTYQLEVLGSTLFTPVDAKSPSAKAALSYLEGSLSLDSCGRQAKAYLEAILSGASSAQAAAEATGVYIRDYNAGQRAAPGSPCAASDIAFREAAVAGQNPVLAAALAFMKSYGSDSPCFVSARDYVESTVAGSTQTEANIRAAKSFTRQLQTLAAQGKGVDKACAASAQAFSSSSESASAPIGAAMQAFISKALETGNGVDPLCFSAAERFFEGFESGKVELVSTLAAAREFMRGFKNSPTISSRSPCAAAATAYAAATENAASSPNAAAMQAFISKALETGNGFDPVCLSAAERFFDSFESGKPELQSTFAAAKEFLKGYKNSPISASRSPCGAAAKAYAAAVNTPSSPNAAAMEAFINKALETGDGFDSACAKSAEKFFESFESGKLERESTFAAARNFLQGYKNSPTPASRSPCAAAAKAYAAATKNSHSPPTQQALLAFIDEAVFTADDGLDPVCGASAEAYFNTYLTGAGEAAASEAAAVAYLEAVGANPSFDPESPCGRAAKAYIAAF